jgi:hypothetical protein
MKKRISTRIHCNYGGSAQSIFQALKAIEEILKTKLDFLILPNGQLKLIPDKEKWLLDNVKNDGFEIICNGSETDYIGIDGSKGLQEGNYILLKTPQKPEYISKLTPLIEKLGDILEAFFITSDPGETAGKTNFRYQSGDYGENPYRLPWLAPMFQYKILPSAMADSFGWINYWSKKVANNAGFDPEKDKQYFDICYPTQKGWLLQITKDPLNLEIPEHLEKLKAAYNRFKKVGGQDLLK